MVLTDVIRDVATHQVLIKNQNVMKRRSHFRSLSVCISEMLLKSVVCSCYCNV